VVTQRGIAAAHNPNERRSSFRLGVQFPGQAANLRQEKSHMAIQAHLAELEKKHRALEDEINEALTHPSTDDLKVVELKRRKLQLKDEIMRLRQDASVH
jgi:hypothetical protein